MDSYEDAVEDRVVDIPVKEVRKMTDPYVAGRYTIDAFVDVREWVHLPNDPNARDPEVGKDRQVYKNVRIALLDGRDPKGGDDMVEPVTPTSFLYKCQGAHVVARDTQYIKRDQYAREYGPTTSDMLRLFLRPPSDEYLGDGLVNGSHLQAAIEEMNEKHGSKVPPNLVKLSVSVGLPQDLIPEVSRGNNSSIQVRSEAIVNLEGKFDRIKQTLAGTKLDGHVDWGTGIAGRTDDGTIEKGIIDAPMIVAVLKCLLPDPAPPINAYAYRTGIIEEFAKNPQRYYKALPLLTQGLTLLETIRTTAGDNYPGKYGALKCVQTRTMPPGKDGKPRKRPPFVLPFTGVQADQVLGLEAAFAMFGAFRHFIRETDTECSWIVPFEDVVKAWHKVSAECVSAANNVLNTNGHNLNALGKSRVYWPMVDLIVKNARLEYGPPRAA